MAIIDLKDATPDATVPAGAFLFGADSQVATSPSVYSIQAIATYVNVKAYGAVGDGVANDHVAIQAAIDDLAESITGYYSEATGRALYFPAGVYLIDEPLVFPEDSGVSLIGEGKTKSTIFQETTDTDILQLSGVNCRSVIEAMRLAGPTGQVGGTGKAINVATSGNQIDVKDCWINNIGYAMYGNPTSDSNFSGNVIEYCLTPVQLLGSGNGFFNISRNVFYNCGPVGLGGGEQRSSFSFNATTNLVFTGNRIVADSAMSPQTDGLFSFEDVTDLVFSDNVFTDTVYTAHTFIFTDCSRIKFTNNILKESYKAQLLAFGCSDLVIQTNTIAPMKSPGSVGMPLMYFEGCSSVKIKDNLIGKSTLYNIHIDDGAGTSEAFDISGNTFDGGTAIDIYACVFVQATSGIQFNSNTFVNTGDNTRDFLSDTTERLTMVGNLFVKDYYIDASTAPAHVDGNVGGEKTYLNAAPASGTWSLGDKVYFDTPTASGFIGAVCVTAGSPGTWKTFGEISA